MPPACVEGSAMTLSEQIQELGKAFEQLGDAFWEAVTPFCNWAIKKMMIFINWNDKTRMKGS